MQISALIEAVREWAQQRADMLAVAIVGSHARGTATPESDLDVMLLTSDVAPYLDETSWASRFGDVGTAVEEDWGAVTSLRVHYGDGVEVEFGFTTATWAGLPVDDGTRRVVADGMQVLWDPHGLLGRLQQAVVGSPAGSR